jgi:nitrite reductase/ring-hydroxylating ferredoxin subunit
MNPAENDELCLTGPGTPCGQLMRRYWIPVGAAAELKDLPKVVHVLGEELVLFRDGHGRPGLLAKHCSHRGTSLEYGQIEEQGLRCCYHGWLYDVAGKILDMPAEPPDSTFKHRLRHLAYPCRELGGLVFAYMGPPETMPELPGYDFLVREDGIREISYRIMPCNYLQSLENIADPVHTAILHRRQFPEGYSAIPRFDIERTEYGLIITAMRRGSRPNTRWHRQTLLLLPCLQIFAPSDWYEGEPADMTGEPATVAVWKLPIDDTHFMRWQLVFIPVDAEGQPTRPLRKRRVGYGGPRERTYEETQRDPGDDEAQISQGPIGRREQWHLASSDRGVIAVQKMYREAIDLVRQAGDPPGVIRDPERARFVDARPIDALVSVA